MRGAPRDVTRAALLICGAIVFLGAGLFARATGSARAQTELPLGGPIVLIPSGDVLIGAREEAIYQAAALCRAESRFDGGASCTIERFANELHTRVAHVARFGIDRTEVSRGAYRACVASGRCAPSSEIVDDLTSGEDGLPVAGIDLPRAERYCAARGGRLPTEEEWTRAARGDDERSFPWGSSYDPGLANHGRPPGLADPSDGFLHAAPVGSFPSGASPFGVLDLAGNVWEWTSSMPTEDDLSLLGAPMTPEAFRVLRGGSFLHPAHALRVSARNFAAPLDLASADLGLRCAYDL
jgi:formylglycine-generating enzyme required for sulfatase activity